MSSGNHSIIPYSAIILAILSLWIGLGDLGWSTAQKGYTAALIFFIIGSWATEAFPAHITALLFFCLAMLLDIAPAKVTFSGFHSPAIWLVFAGIVLGTTIVKTGLGNRLAGLLSERLDTSYAGLITTVTLAGMVLGFIIPTSMGRMAFLIPVVIFITQHYGFKPGSNGYYGLIMSAAFGSHVSNFGVLTANVVNVILSGFSESLYGTTVYYGEFLILHYPIIGIAKSMVIILLTLWLYPDIPLRNAPKGSHTSIPFTVAEKRLAYGLLAALALWMTDSFHHISPAWIGLLAALYCLMPDFGPLSANDDFAALDLRPLFFVAGVIGAGSLVAHSGLGDLLSLELQKVLPLKAGADFLNFMTLAIIATLTSLVTTLPGAPAVLTPFSQEMANITGFSLEAVLMLQMVGFAMAPFPYQAPPLMAALSLGRIPLMVAIRFSLILAAAHLFILMPLDFLWWKLLGWI